MERIPLTCFTSLNSPTTVFSASNLCTSFIGAVLPPTTSATWATNPLSTCTIHNTIIPSSFVLFHLHAQITVQSFTYRPGRNGWCYNLPIEQAWKCVQLSLVQRCDRNQTLCPHNLSAFQTGRNTNHLSDSITSLKKSPLFINFGTPANQINMEH